jgi:hypothetical protein
VKLHRSLIVLFVVAIWFAVNLPQAHAGVRLALVLGNAKYEAVPALDNPSNDAADLAQALRRVGFEVIEQRDATREAMAKAVRDFSQRLRGADVALFFYAGHGLQMNGENYLLPVDARIETAADVRFNTINLSDIQQEMEGSGRANIIILDACRNNPFAEKLSRGGRGATTRGLGRIDATGEGSLIVYSTQPNNVALDGAGRNSPFTEALIKYVGTPGLEVRQMISKVRGDVLQATDRRQTPWDSSSLVGDVYLAGAPSVECQRPTAASTSGGSEQWRLHPRRSPRWRRRQLHRLRTSRAPARSPRSSGNATGACSSSTSAGWYFFSENSKASAGRAHADLLSVPADGAGVACAPSRCRFPRRKSSPRTMSRSISRRSPIIIFPIRRMR